MKDEAPEKIRATLTPEVFIEFARDTEEGIVARVRQVYHYPERPNLPSIPWSKIIEVEADKDGNILSTKGLF